MNKIKILLCSLTLSGLTFTQQNPTGTPPTGSTAQRANSAWYRGGNFQGGPAGNSNIFGTMWNSPIYTYTNGIPRMKLNGNIGSTVNNYTTQKNGFLLLGTDAQSFGGSNLYTQLGAFSLLHLNGSTGSDLQEYGYRPWMRTGVTFTDNSDLSYFGLRQLGTANQLDLTETVLLWSDNPVNNQWGPDKMVFRFSGWGGSDGATVNSNRLSTTDLDGLHVAQFTGTGLMGLGNTFGTNAATMNAANYIDPQSLLHMSYDHRGGVANEAYGFMQITYRANGNLRGSGETNADGLRFGIDNQVINNGMNAYLRWQENTPFIVQTDWNNGPGGIEAGERMRTTTTGALVNDPNYFGINGNGGNITRVSISRDGGSPVQRPMSLLHLGYDIVQGATGWRSWMDVGSLYSIGGRFGDNMYVGMKRETGFDRFDAVINWGDNQPNTSQGSDYLRFIFTSNLGGAGDAASGDGLEVMRMDPKDGDTYSYNNFGMIGIGNYATNGPNTAAADVIDAKLDIDGDLRIRKVEQDSTLTQVLVIDSTDHNRVYWKDISDLTSNVQANNGTSLDPNSTDPIVQLGQELVGGALAYNGIGELLNDREIPMNGHDLVFSSSNNGLTQPGIERIAIGVNPPSLPGNPYIGTIPNSFFTDASSKLQVYNATEQTGAHFFTFMDPAGVGFAPDQYSGARGTVYGLHNDKSIIGLLGQGLSLLAGVRVEGVRGEALGVGNNVGVRGYSLVTGVRSIGGEFTSTGHLGSCLSGTSIGVKARATGSNTSNIAIFGEVETGNPCNAGENYAAWLNGDVFVNGNVTSASDERLKTNIQTIDGDFALNIIQNLNPVSFDYDNSINPRMVLPNGGQYGFIAQDVSQVLPNIVHTTTLPAELDSLGNQISPEFPFLSLETQDLIPVLFSAFKNQMTTIDSLEEKINTQDSLINNLNDRLNNLENCLQNILPILCQMNQSLIMTNDDNVQQQLRAIINIELENGENIVLNQNVPNPFAEQTIITYSIPSSVNDAKIVFYDMKGIVIKTVNIDTRGQGQLNVYGADLSTGLYSYTLIADGQVIATKKMVKQ